MFARLDDSAVSVMDGAPAASGNTRRVLPATARSRAVVALR